MAKRKKTTEETGRSRRETRGPEKDADYVMGLYESRIAQGDEAKLRRRIVDMRLLCSMEHQLQVPDQYKAITKEVRTPFANDALKRVTAALTQHPPVAHVDPISEDSEPDRASANVAERWIAAVFEAMNQSLGEDVIYESTKALVRDEESVIKVVHRPDAWAHFPEREDGEDASEYSERVVGFQKRAKVPFAWRVVDRRSMLFGDGEYGDDWAIEYGEYPTPYLASRYGMRSEDGRLTNPEDLLGGKPAPEGDLESSEGHTVKVEYWDPDTWSVVIDGSLAPGFPKKNPYGQLPYFRAKTSEGALFSLSFLVPALDELITMKMNWAYLGAYPNPVLEPVPNSQQLPEGLSNLEGNDGQSPAFTWKPGKMLKPPMGYKFGFLSPPPVGSDIDETIAILRNLIDVAGIPSVFRGVGGADQPGYAINQLIAAAVLSYRVLTLAAQKQLQSAGEFIWDLVRYRIKQPVYVRETFAIDKTGKRRELERSNWLAVKPIASEDGGGKNMGSLDRVSSLSYTFRPVLPTDEQARAMIASQLVNAPKPLSSVRHALEKFLQEESPDDIMDEAWVEDQLRKPTLEGQILQEAMRKAGLIPQGGPSAQLVGPTGAPLGGGGGGMGGVPGMPSVPGLNMPLAPSAPAGPSAIMPGQGGRVAGAMPGRPGGPNR